MSPRTHRLLRPLLVACLLVACDAPPPPGDEQAKVIAPTATAPAADPPVADSPVAFDACLAACDDKKLSADDRATCRLSCNQAEAVERRAIGAAPAGDSPHKPIVDAFRACNQPCQAAVDPAARDACAARCAAEAGALPQPCQGACLTALSASDTACAAKGPDDAATCRLNSAADAHVCLGKC
jgi:hypothetical protein